MKNVLNYGGAALSFLTAAFALAQQAYTANPSVGVSQLLAIVLGTAISAAGGHQRK